MRSLAVLSIALTLSAGAAQAAAPAEGRWRTHDHDAEVVIAACGEALCGRLVDSDDIRADPAVADRKNKDPALRSRPLKNLMLLQGFTGGPAEWKAGTVYSPADGAIYKGSILILDPDTLQLTGCIVAPLCQTQTWKRIK